MRTVVAVCLAAALLAVSLPAAERALTERAATLAAGELDRLDAAAATLAAETDPVPDGVPGARRPFRFEFPRASSAGPTPERTTLECADGDCRTVVVSLRFSDGRTREFRRSGVQFRPAGGRLVLRQGGSHRLTLEHRLREGRSVVVVRRDPSR